jgi:glycine/D-amino acid oxidase-like deaminating enzyme
LNLIIGQGIAGTWLSYYLHKQGQSLVVMDDGQPSTPSRVAGGLINPVTGRRYSVTWLADEIIPFAYDAYRELGEVLGEPLIRETEILDFFPSAQMRVNFQERDAESEQYFSACDEQAFHSYFNFAFGCGRIRPAYVVNMQATLNLWRRQLEENDQFIPEQFNPGKLEWDKKQLRYNGISYERIIFCNGNDAFTYPWFQNLPYAASKGESLLLRIEGLPYGFVFKHGMLILPGAEKDLYWIGSSYEWEFEDAGPTNAFLDKTRRVLDAFLKLPYEILEHRSAIRPSTLERRPFVGVHPSHPHMAMLNGLGTKGCSLAPYFARQLTDRIINDKPIHPLADISRFQKILSRNFSRE